MDRITEGLLGEFSAEFQVDDRPEDERFELFTSWLTVRRHYSESTFDPKNTRTGNGGDTGIDAIAIVVNNNLITDVDEVEDLLEANNYLDVSFVFVQAERSPHFDAQKIGNFGFGVSDFFESQKLPRNDKVRQFDEIMKFCFSHSSKFRPHNPVCSLYYVTSGGSADDQNLQIRRASVISDLVKTGMFSRVDFTLYGSADIQRLYRASKTMWRANFDFPLKTVLPKAAGVREAYLGYLPANELLRLVCDDDGEIIKSLFYDNIRDWVGYNDINKEIRDTLLSDGKDCFVIMHNGVTIVARTLNAVGNHFTMSEFQIVNGCHTTHVLNDNRDLLTDAVQVPLRIIATRDEGVIERIIKGTNRQTATRSEQFFAMKDFAKNLEEYFRHFTIDRRLYYERRPHQYDNADLHKRKIINHQDLVRAVGAMFLGEPHITTKTFRNLTARVGTSFFKDTDKLEIYHTSAVCAHQMDNMFDAGKLDPKYKPARYQMMLAARFIMDNQGLPAWNSKQIAARCEEMLKKLWNNGEAEKIFNDAAKIIDKVGGIEWDRDSIRLEPITKAIFEAFSLHYRVRL